ncbi:unnamed protein product [Staurois parvus]|uniref:Uncharacterized protein n=1 Tax=Staurois parvus TaxID=386267 RepID=A0ABN9GBL1_9NEOB|nr:unnamed protein product [Staurois parvus]
MDPYQGRTDHLETRALTEVSRGPHEMPLVPFLSLGKSTGAP